MGTIGCLERQKKDRNNDGLTQMCKGFSSGRKNKTEIENEWEWRYRTFLDSRACEKGRYS